MKKIKNLSAILIAIITVFANTTVAYAAPQTMPDGNVFDAEYYAANYADVVAVFGTDVNALYSHYKTYGINEGRLPYDGAIAPAVKRSNVAENLAQARIKYSGNKNIIKVIDYLDTIVNDSMTEREIVTILHDEICNKTEYCYEYLTTRNRNLLSKGVIDDFESFKNGTFHSICSGYAWNFEVLCLLSGIRAQYISGSVGGGGHAWNRVMLDGAWYDIDTTWDDCFSNKDYFLVPAGTGVFAERTFDLGSPTECFLLTNGLIRCIPADQITDYDAAKEKIKTMNDRL